MDNSKSGNFINLVDSDEGDSDEGEMVEGEMVEKVPKQPIDLSSDSEHLDDGAAETEPESEEDIDGGKGGDIDGGKGGDIERTFDNPHEAMDVDDFGDSSTQQIKRKRGRKTPAEKIATWDSEQKAAYLNEQVSLDLQIIGIAMEYDLPFETLVVDQSATPPTFILNTQWTPELVNQVQERLKNYRDQKRLEMWLAFLREKVTKISTRETSAASEEMSVALDKMMQMEQDRKYVDNLTDGDSVIMTLPPTKKQTWGFNTWLASQDAVTKHNDALITRLQSPYGLDVRFLQEKVRDFQKLDYGALTADEIIEYFDVYMKREEERRENMEKYGLVSRRGTSAKRNNSTNAAQRKAEREAKAAKREAEKEAKAAKKEAEKKAKLAGVAKRELEDARKEAAKEERDFKSKFSNLSTILELDSDAYKREVKLYSEILNQRYNDEISAQQEHGYVSWKYDVVHKSLCVAEDKWINKMYAVVGKPILTELLELYTKRLDATFGMQNENTWFLVHQLELARMWLETARVNALEIERQKASRSEDKRRDYDKIIDYLDNWNSDTYMNTEQKSQKLVDLSRLHLKDLVQNVVDQRKPWAKNAVAYFDWFEETISEAELDDEAETALLNKVLTHFKQIKEEIDNYTANSTNEEEKSQYAKMITYLQDLHQDNDGEGIKESRLPLPTELLNVSLTNMVTRVVGNDKKKRWLKPALSYFKQFEPSTPKVKPSDQAGPLTFVNQFKEAVSKYFDDDSTRAHTGLLVDVLNQKVAKYKYDFESLVYFQHKWNKYFETTDGDLQARLGTTYMEVGKDRVRRKLSYMENQCQTSIRNHSDATEAKFTALYALEWEAEDNVRSRCFTNSENYTTDQIVNNSEWNSLLLSDDRLKATISYDAWNSIEAYRKKHASTHRDDQIFLNAIKDRLDHLRLTGLVIFKQKEKEDEERTKADRQERARVKRVEEREKKAALEARQNAKIEQLKKNAGEKMTKRLDTAVRKASQSAVAIALMDSELDFEQRKLDMFQTLRGVTTNYKKEHYPWRDNKLDAPAQKLSERYKKTEDNKANVDHTSTDGSIDCMFTWPVAQEPFSVDQLDFLFVDAQTANAACTNTTDTVAMDVELDADTSKTTPGSSADSSGQDASQKAAVKPGGSSTASRLNTDAVIDSSPMLFNKAYARCILAEHLKSIHQQHKLAVQGQGFADENGKFVAIKKGGDGHLDYERRVLPNPGARFVDVAGALGPITTTNDPTSGAVDNHKLLAVVEQLLPCFENMLRYRNTVLMAKKIELQQARQMLTELTETDMENMKEEIKAAQVELENVQNLYQQTTDDAVRAEQKVIIDNKTKYIEYRRVTLESEANKEAANIDAQLAIISEKRIPGVWKEVDAKRMLDAAHGHLPGQLYTPQPTYLPLRISAPPRVGKSATALLVASLAKRMEMTCFYSVSPDKKAPIAEMLKKLERIGWKRPIEVRERTLRKEDNGSEFYHSSRQVRMDFRCATIDQVVLSPQATPKLEQQNYENDEDLELDEDSENKRTLLQTNLADTKKNVDMILYSSDYERDVKKVASLLSEWRSTSRVIFHIRDEAQSLAKEEKNDVSPAHVAFVPPPPTLLFLRSYYGNLFGLNCLVTATLFPTFLEEDLWGYFGSSEQNIKASLPVAATGDQIKSRLGSIYLPKIVPALKPFVSNGYMGTTHLVEWCYVENLDVSGVIPMKVKGEVATLHLSQNTSHSGKTLQEAQVLADQISQEQAAKKHRYDALRKIMPTYQRLSRSDRRTRGQENQLKHFNSIYGKELEELVQAPMVYEQYMNELLEPPEDENLRKDPKLLAAREDAYAIQAHFRDWYHNNTESTLATYYGGNDPEAPAGEDTIVPMYIGALNDHVVDEAMVSFVHTFGREAHEKAREDRGNLEGGQHGIAFCFFQTRFYSYGAIGKHAGSGGQVFRFDSTHEDYVAGMTLTKQHTLKNISKSENGSSLTVFIYNPKDVKNFGSSENPTHPSFGVVLAANAEDAVNYVWEKYKINKIAILGHRMFKAGLTVQCAIREGARVRHYCPSHIAYAMTPTTPLDTQLQVVGRTFVELKNTKAPPNWKIHLLGAPGLVESLKTYAMMEDTLANINASALGSKWIKLANEPSREDSLSPYENSTLGNILITKENESLVRATLTVPMEKLRELHLDMTDEDYVEVDDTKFYIRMHDFDDSIETKWQLSPQRPSTGTAFQDEALSSLFESYFTEAKNDLVITLSAAEMKKADLKHVTPYSYIKTDHGEFYKQLGGLERKLPLFRALKESFSATLIASVRYGAIGLVGTRRGGFKAILGFTHEAVQRRAMMADVRNQRTMLSTASKEAGLPKPIEEVSREQAGSLLKEATRKRQGEETDPEDQSKKLRHDDVPKNMQLDTPVQRAAFRELFIRAPRLPQLMQEADHSKLSVIAHILQNW